MKFSLWSKSSNSKIKTVEALIEEWEKETDEKKAGQKALQIGLHYKKVGSSEDREKAFEWIKKAADLGNRDAQYKLGVLYKENTNEEERKNALIWFREAAKRGHAEAQYELGAYLLSEWMEAENWFNKSLCHNNPKVSGKVNFLRGKYCAFLADHTSLSERTSEEGRQRQAIAHQLAAHYYLAAAKSGHSGAALELGALCALFWSRNHVVNTINPTQALRLLERAVDDLPFEDQHRANMVLGELEKQHRPSTHPKP